MCSCPISNDQMPSNYWGPARFVSSEEIGSVGSPSVKVLKITVDFHIEDEFGVGCNSCVTYVVGQRLDGVVLWWENLYQHLKPFKMQLVGEIMRIENDNQIREFNAIHHRTNP